MAKGRDDAVLNWATKQYHRYRNILVDGAMVISPEPGLKVIIQSFNYYQDGIGASMTITSTGVDTVRLRFGGLNTQIQSFPLFAGLPDEPVTIAVEVDGGASGVEIIVFWLEI